MSVFILYQFILVLVGCEVYTEEKSKASAVVYATSGDVAILDFLSSVALFGDAARKLTIPATPLYPTAYQLTSAAKEVLCDFYIPTTVALFSSYFYYCT
jgi:hypothetical protein